MTTFILIRGPDVYSPVYWSQFLAVGGHLFYSSECHLANLINLEGHTSGNTQVKGKLTEYKQAWLYSEVIVFSKILKIGNPYDICLPIDKVFTVGQNTYHCNTIDHLHENVYEI